MKKYKFYDIVVEVAEGHTWVAADRDGSIYSYIAQPEWDYPPGQWYVPTPYEKGCNLTYLGETVTGAEVAVPVGTLEEVVDYTLNRTPGYEEDEIPHRCPGCDEEMKLAEGIDYYCVNDGCTYAMDELPKKHNFVGLLDNPVFMAGDFDIDPRGEEDVVNSPSHYQLFPDGTEAIDVIRAALTEEEFIGYCKGNFLKYRLRAGNKDALEQDIAKSNKYVEFMNDSTT